MEWSRDSAAVFDAPAARTKGRMPAHALKMSDRFGLCSR